LEPIFSVKSPSEIFKPILENRYISVFMLQYIPVVQRPRLQSKYNYLYSLGVIQRVRLENWMCHSSWEW
jgi:hypothetical protein